MKSYLRIGAITVAAGVFLSEEYCSISFTRAERKSCTSNFLRVWLRLVHALWIKPGLCMLWSTSFPCSTRIHFPSSTLPSIGPFVTATTFPFFLNSTPLNTRQHSHSRCFICKSLTRLLAVSLLPPFSPLSSCFVFVFYSPSLFAILCVVCPCSFLPNDCTPHPF